jgi:hypothetical protein
VSAEPVVPDDLAELDQWAVWRLEAGSKIPYRTNGRRASSTDLRHWGGLEEARRALEGGRYSGLAFVFVFDDGLVGIDLDDCIAGADALQPWARGIVERFGDTYVETSPGRKGIKIWARGKLPSNLPGVKVGDGAVEMYDHARYFTFTGHAFRGAPLQVEHHEADLLRLYEHLTRGRKTWPLQPLQGGRIPHGQQHSTMVSIAGTLRARRVCDQAISACLLSINEHQCERPGPPENIARIVRSSRRWGSVG